MGVRIYLHTTRIHTVWVFYKILIIYSLNFNWLNYMVKLSNFLWDYLALLLGGWFGLYTNLFFLYWLFFLIWDYLLKQLEVYTSLVIIGTRRIGIG